MTRWNRENNRAPLSGSPALAGTDSRAAPRCARVAGGEENHCTTDCSAVAFLFSSPPLIGSATQPPPSISPRLQNPVPGHFCRHFQRPFPGRSAAHAAAMRPQDGVIAATLPRARPKRAGNSRQRAACRGGAHRHHPAHAQPTTAAAQTPAQRLLCGTSARQQAAKRGSDPPISSQTAIRDARAPTTFPSQDDTARSAVSPLCHPHAPRSSTPAPTRKTNPSPAKQRYKLPLMQDAKQKTKKT